MLPILPMLPLSLVSSALVPSTSSPLLTPAAGRSAAAAISLQYRGYRAGDDRVLEFERFESIKAAICSATSGTIASAPVKLSTLVSSKALESAPALAQWQWGIGSMGVELALFGLVYRCAVRNDDNYMLKQGAVGAFALMHSLSSTHAAKMWSPEMWLSLGIHFGEAALAFGCAAAALEFAWDKGWGTRLNYLPGMSYGYGGSNRRYGSGYASGYRTSRSLTSRSGGRYSMYDSNPRGDIDEAWGYFGESRDDAGGIRRAYKPYSRYEDPVIR